MFSRLMRRALRISTVTALAVLTVGCNPFESPTPGAVAPNGKGVVTGRISRCEGTFDPNVSRYVPGTVSVLKGRLTWKALGAGMSTPVLPALLVAQATVTADSSYRFVLDPGQYVLRGDDSSAIAVPGRFISVTVKTGLIMDVDIPNACK